MPKKKAPPAEPLHSDDVRLVSHVIELVADAADDMTGAQWEKFAEALRKALPSG